MSMGFDERARRWHYVWLFLFGINHLTTKPINIKFEQYNLVSSIQQQGVIMRENPILPPFYLFFAIVLIVVLHFLVPGMKIVSFPWNLWGLLPLGVGIGFNLAADGAFKKAKTTVKPFQESSALITHGVFRFSRHPMYLGFILILVGITILFGSLTPYAIIVIFGIFMDRYFITTEEKMMEEQFGDKWHEYRKSVRRWI